MTYEETNRSGEPPRLFTAITLPDQMRAELHHIGRQSKEMLRFQKWTHPDDIHITLKFLGETPASRIDEVIGSLRATAADGSLLPFGLAVAGLGVFGPPARPTILWAGLKGGLKPLHELQYKVDTAMTILGYEREREDRAYRPHLTLARRYNGITAFNRRELEAAGKLLPAEEMIWTVRSFTLYRSHFGRTPMYEAIAEFPLTADAQADRAP